MTVTYRSVNDMTVTYRSVNDMTVTYRSVNDMTVTYRSVNVLCALKLCDRQEEDDLSKKVGGPKNKIDSSEVSVSSLSATPPVTPPATSTPVKEMHADSLPDVITSPIAMPEHQCTPSTDNYSRTNFIRNTNAHWHCILAVQTIVKHNTQASRQSDTSADEGGRGVPHTSDKD